MTMNNVCVRGCRTHLDLQLLNHLHLDSALGSAAVVKGMFIVQVSNKVKTAFSLGIKTD